MLRLDPSRQPVRNIRRITTRSVTLPQISRRVDTAGVVYASGFVKCTDVVCAASIDALGEAVAGGGTGGSFT